MIQKYLNELTKYLQAFLEKNLPKVSNDYWSNCVLHYLSHQQKQEIERKKIKTIFQLDNASLLRIFDKNLSELTFRAELENNSKSLILRMTELRNKYAHPDASQTDVQTLFIELSTIEEFYKLIKVPQEIISKVTNEKNAIFQTNIVQTNQSENSPASKFSKGDTVVVASDKSKIGSVTNVMLNDAETKYKVMINGKASEFYESQLEEFIELESVDFIDISQFNAKLSSQQILNPSTKTLLGTNSGNVDFIPYQYRPVMKIIQSDRPRILIADEVGIGKTIEAILIMRELQARQDLNKIMVICPKPLVTEKKWKKELKRFNEEFEQLDRQGFKSVLEEYNRDGEIPKNRSKIIVPYSVFDSEIVEGINNNNNRRRRNNNGLLNIDPPPKFDMIIVDEAHKIRNTDRYSYKAVEYLCRNADAVIFLTATPIQLDDSNLFTLLNVLNPDYFIDYETFKMISEPNRYINEALKIINQKEAEWQNQAIEKLGYANNTQWGKQIFNNHPGFEKVIEILNSEEVNNEKKVELNYEIEQLHTLSNFINRTRRRHIGDFTKRNSRTIEVSFTDSQKILYSKIIDLKRDILMILHDSKNTGFMISTLLRQTSSSIFGLIPFLEDILNRGYEDIDMDMILDEKIIQKLRSFEPIRDRIDEVMNLANNLDKNDEKYENLKRIILEKSKMENKKLMIFSSFRHTISYLMERFEEDGIKCETIHGDVDDSNRYTIKERFAFDSNLEDGFDVLLSSEVGSEGLDFQFCDAIVNYDIPWNPMRVEQRIGRIDRYGQKSEVIAIYNFITKDTIDYTIYDRCLLRIGIFESSLGASEEILGDIHTQIKNIALDFELSEEQKNEKIEQLTENKIREIKEVERLEDESENLVGIDYNKSRMLNEIENKKNYWLSSVLIENLVVRFFEDFLGKNVINGEKAIKNLRLSTEDRQKLLVNYRNNELPGNYTNKEWENWLRGYEQNLAITFEPNQKNENKPVVFINILHPLVKQAANHFRENNQIYISLKYKTNEIPEGNYPFALYLWIKKGWKNELLYQPICKNKFIMENFIEIIKNAENGNFNDTSLIDTAELDNIHYNLWVEARKEFQEFNTRQINSKLESLKFSFYRRKANIKNILETNFDDRIQTMKKSELEKINEEERRKIEENEIKKNEVDILSETVAYGFVEIINIGEGK